MNIRKCETLNLRFGKCEKSQIGYKIKLKAPLPASKFTEKTCLEFTWIELILFRIHLSTAVYVSMPMNILMWCSSFHSSRKHLSVCGFRWEFLEQTRSFMVILVVFIYISLFVGKKCLFDFNGFCIVLVSSVFCECTYIKCSSSLTASEKISLYFLAIFLCKSRFNLLWIISAFL